MLSLGRMLLTRIRAEVPGFKTVQFGSLLMPAVLAGDIGPLLPACAVTPGAGELEPQGAAAQIGIETQEWDIVVIIANNHDDEQFGTAELVASALMMGVYHALHGWKNHNQLRGHGMVYKSRYDPVYNLGWAMFPMSFTVKAVIGREYE